VYLSLTGALKPLNKEGTGSDGMFSNVKDCSASFNSSTCIRIQALTSTQTDLLSVGASSKRLAVIVAVVLVHTTCVKLALYKIASSSEKRLNAKAAAHTVSTYDVADALVSSHVVINSYTILK
jgi:hypothetical protein